MKVKYLMVDIQDYFSQSSCEKFLVCVDFDAQLEKPLCHV